MKKIILTLLALGMAMLAMVAFAPTAAASDHNKQVTFCHATGVDGKYLKLTLPLQGFLNGHYDHTPGSNEDIWAAFSYTNARGDVVNIPANGDTSLLAFPNCKRPVVDTELTVPGATFADPCGTANDRFTVAGGTGYTVGPVVQNSDGTQSITVTALEGFTFPGGEDSVTITKPGFTNVDCDLPVTGASTTNVVGGLLVLTLIAAGAVFLHLRRNSV